MKAIKRSRAASLAVILFVYLAAAAVGIFTYMALELEWWLSLLIADVLATVVTFAFSVLLSNASVYDPYWSVQPPVIVTAFAVGRGLNAFGILLIVAVLFWGIRLTANWAYTFPSLEHQDWRYTMLHERTGALYPLVNFVGIHMVPTLVVYCCILPAVYALQAGLRANVGAVIFVALSILAATMQGIADIQMHKYRKNRTSPYIRVGLWKYSRHPNYLGEILMWWGIALAVVCAAPKAWYLILGAVLNTILFFSVSIPMADARQSRKEGFEEYKKSTRMLLPIKK